MTPEQKDAVVVEVRRQLLEYLETEEFEQRATRACIAFEHGGLRTDIELADALGIPVQALSVAIECHRQKFFAMNGGLQ